MSGGRGFTHGLARGGVTAIPHGLRRSISNIKTIPTKRYFKKEEDDRGGRRGIYRAYPGKPPLPSMIAFALLYLTRY